MEFTNRQLSILSYILHQSDGVKGTELAEYMNISIRTLQLEIKAINGK